MCPERIDGWSPEPEPRRSDTSSFTFFGATANYIVRYAPSEDLQRFLIRVRHNVDTDLVFRGGVGQALTVSRENVVTGVEVLRLEDYID